MDHYKSIKTAYKAIKAHRYLEAISLLQRINENKQDRYTLYLQAISFLLLKKFNDAEKVINHIKYIDPVYLPLKELEAFLFFKAASNADEVILKYYELQDIGKNKKLYQKIIKKIQKTNNFSKLQKKILLFQSVVIPKPPKKNYPKSNKNLNQYDDNASNYKANTNKKYILMIVIIFLLLFILFLLKLNYNTLLKAFTKNYQVNDEKDIITLDDNKYSIIDKIVSKRTNIFYYDEHQLKHDFNNIQFLIKDKNYNNALILINKIKNSNANFIVKEKLKLFDSIIKNAKDRKISKLNYKDLIKKPYLFNNIMIQCEGKISNLEKIKDRYIFTLLVDYRDKDKFTGIFEVISIKIDSNINIDNGDMVKIKAIFTDKVNNTNKIIIKALSIKKLM